MSTLRAGGSSRAALVGTVLVVGGMVVAVLMSAFAAVDGTARDVRTSSGPVGEGSAVDGAWDAVRGTWARTGEGTQVRTPGDRLSVLVRPVGGTEGALTATGTPEVDGWSVVFRWHDAGTYGLVTFTPSARRVDILAVVSDRTRPVATAPLDPEDVADGAVTVDLAGPIVRARAGDDLLVAGRVDDLLGGDHAGVALVGDDASARFDRFATAPPPPAMARRIEAGS